MAPNVQPPRVDCSLVLRPLPGSLCGKLHLRAASRHTASMLQQGGGAASQAAADPLPASSASAGGGKLEVRIVSWHAVASWTWNAGDDVCGICRTAFDGCPPEAKFPGDDAPVVWGACNHAFHLPCITKWLAPQAAPACPICRRPWEFRA